MIGSVTISGKEVPLKATASTLRKYRARFNRDLIKDFKEVEKAFTSDGSISGEIFVIVEDLTYIMAKQAEKADLTKLNEDDFIGWLEGFEPMDFANSAEEILNAYMGNMVTSANP